MKDHDIYVTKDCELIGFVVEGIGELKDLWYNIIPTVAPELIMTKNWMALMPIGTKQRFLFINTIDERPPIILHHRKVRLVKLKKKQHKNSYGKKERN